jgi:glycine/D-amino acid oxidase-like deaminating enzyme
LHSYSLVLILFTSSQHIPSDFSFGEITPDIERMAPFVEKAMLRVPASMNAGLKTFFCGPESFSPDLGPICGEAPELRNYFVAAGQFRVVYCIVLCSARTTVLVP